MKCLIIINRLSGNGKRADEHMLTQTFGKGFDMEVFFVKKNGTLPSLLPFDRIVACGGDGTLNSVLNQKTKPDAQIFYCPYGTLNEASKGKQTVMLRDVGMANEKKFAYVFACGIFTPLGYKTKDSKKQRLKALAYITNVIKQYKTHDIPATIELDGIKNKDTYTLILVIDSKKCFGLNFNKAYRQDDKKMHLLTIRSPKSKGGFGKIKVFFSLFRAFFVGFDKPYKSKNMWFAPFEKLTLSLEKPTDFCMDGELEVLQGKFDVSVSQADVPVQIVCDEKIKQYAKENKSF